MMLELVLEKVVIIDNTQAYPNFEYKDFDSLGSVQ